MKLFFCALLAVFVACVAHSHCQPPRNYPVGFKTIHLTDSSRKYKPDVISGHPLHYRPVDIDLWYPAMSPAGGRKILFGELIRLYEDRAGTYQQEVRYDSLAEELTAYLATSLNLSDALLSGFETSSARDALVAAGNFPLVIYLASVNGMSFENIELFEALATRGYVVACIQSVGRYPGNMTTDWEDVAEQIADGTAAWKHLSRLSFVDSKNIAVAGYSWGGIAAWFVGGHANARAMISLDGAECHAYGMEDDLYFSGIRKEILAASHETLPYLYLQKDSMDGVPDSVFALHQRSHAGEWIKIRHATHEDFSSLTYLSSKIKNDSSGFPFTIARDLTITFLDQQLRGIDGFHELKSGLTAQEKIDTSYSVPLLTSSFLTISGIVREKETGKIMPYVSIGLVGKNYGTVSDSQGLFSLGIPVDDRDTLKISCIGFEDQLIPVPVLRKRKRLVIQMEEKATGMAEVVVEAGRLKTKVIGHTSRSKFFGGKLGLNQLGTSIGVKMNIRKKVMLDEFRFTVSYNQLDTAVFRVNILSFKNGVPGESVIRQNIYCHIGRRPGPYTVDLLPYQIILDQDVLIALEWVEGSAKNVSDYIVFSASPANKGTYLKYSSQGKWKHFRGMGVGFNVEVRILEGDVDGE